MFGLVTARPVAVLMLAAAAALFGVLSYQQLGVELMPDLAYPTITLRTAYPGAAPEEVESEVTRTVEERVGTVEGLLGLRSSSRAGRSEVVLEFAWDTDMDRASQRVRERLGHVRLPDVVSKPQLLRHDPSLAPVLTLALGSEPGGPSLARLRTWA
ncbi:MAG: efflux RND transporter permease subunit, partial [Myxococcales bacterium]|nr:efflux RND transporter permease subunit [Myxococcales bacterium]